jgi:MFS superfamily sulfate permease-like transporter
MALLTYRPWNYYRDALLKTDLKAGVSVFLVALPLCLGIALASGAPLFSGLLAGIVAGLVVSLLSGSEISVSGPAAGLTVIVAQALRTIDTFEGFLLALLLAGMMQVGLGLLKAGRLSSYFPESVIRGMLVAIGLVIILKQIPHALGDDRDFEGVFAFEQSDNENTFTELIKSIVYFNEGALVISLSALGLLLAWERLAGRGIGLFKLLPASLGAVLLGVGLNELFRIMKPAWYLGNSTNHMVSIQQFDTVSEFLGFLNFPDFGALGDVAVYKTALTLAIVASLETLLSLEAADSIDPERRISSGDRELVAQGVGNMASALVGGLPITAVIVRTSANVYAGARTRASSFVHGVLLLGSVLLIPSLLNRIPLAALAAVLIMVGYKLANVAIFRRQFREGIDQFIPFAVTIGFVIFTDLLTGIAIGTAVGLAFVVYSNFQSVIACERDENRVLVTFNKDVFFLNKPKVKQIIMELRPGDHVLFDGTRATFIDHDIFTVLKEFKESARERGITAEFRHVNRRSVGRRAAIVETL